MRPLACIALLLAPAVLAADTPQLPDSTAADRTSVAVTVYNQNLALVREVRNLKIDKSGIATLRFMDVPSSINPRTVHLQSLAPGGPQVFEQNYEFDLVSPDKLLEKYLGKNVIINRKQESRPGERTLPDVPEENYWYRRHVAVYEWIAKRCAGLRVVDLACGEGYGSDLLAETAAEVTGVDANPEAFEHARLRYRRDNLSFERGLVEDFDKEVDAVVFLQTIEHIHEPEKLLAHLAKIAPVSYISTPNRLTLAGPDAEKSENPWHLVEYDIGEYRELLAPHFSSVEVLGLFNARKLRAQEIA